MSKLALSSGASICRTCKYAAGCTLDGDRYSSLLMCEGYVRDERVLGEAAADIMGGRPEAAWSGPDASTMYRGLCTDCVFRENCVLSDPEAGVWQCSEYEQSPV